MAKSPVHLAPGLTLDGDAIAFAGHKTDLKTVITRAHSAAVKIKDDATAFEVNAACKMHASTWGAVLALDPQVAAITPAADPLTVGPILVAAVQRAAQPCADPCALVLAVAEAARQHALATLPKNRERLRALLAEPCTVEAAVWEADCLRFADHTPIGQPATAAHRDAALQAHADACAKVSTHNAAREEAIAGAVADAAVGVPTRPIPPARHHPTAPVFLPAVCLRGGLCGPRGVTLRPAGESALAWAAATWRVSCAVMEGPRKVAEPKAGAAKIAELPVVVLFDGSPTTWGDLSPADLTLALKFKVPTSTGDPAAFVAEATRRRDEAFKIEGEASDLAMVADPSWILYDVPEVQQAAVRGLAVALIAGDARALTFERVRDVARPAFKTRTRTPRSTYQRIGIWAEALLAEVKRVERAALVAREAAELQRRVDKRLEQEARTQARKRAA